ncbi:hypothetical protein NDU88_002929 [Pleurodeles waltl]|uniref:Uncharacterized protein n=1 Tax=Pleurodeles waltl TaxID=8319 RepID=A0AAV7UCW7_PLEWA|nr:hypothetical protein NDU88_002929 [Pleurodeles waltl]
MGRTDAKQQKLHFGAKRHTVAPPDQVEEDALPPLQDAQSGHGEMKALLLTMHSSLSSIDGKMDTMTTRLDLLTAGLEKQSGWITEAEQRISNVEDVMQKRQEQLSQMDKLLKVIALKNEDLEARSRRNNIRIEGQKKFTIVKQKLRQLNIQYAMLNPARLRITHNDRSMTFTAPQQVRDYIKRIRRKDDSRTPEEGPTDSPSTLSDPE